MSGSISFAEIMSLAGFLSRYEGGFIEKNYLGEEGLSFKFRKSGLDSIYLHFTEGKYLYLSQENEIDGKKNALPLENASITKVSQLGTDRVLIVEGPRTVIIELMGGGNLFVLQEGSIVYAKKPGKRGARVLKVGDRYEYPQHIDLRSQQFSFENAISTSSSDPIRTLAVRLGLSKYAEELDCALGHPFKNNSDVLANIEKLKEKISEIYSGAREGKLYVYEDEFYVWRSFCRSEEPEVMGIEEGLKSGLEGNDLEGDRKTEAMRRNMEKMTVEMERLRNTGEFIMSHLGEMDHLINKGKKVDQDKYKIDYEKETISFVEDGMDIELKMNETAGENANDYFGMSKRIKEKLSRVKLEPVVEEKRTELKKVKRVFTNYRWFITSDGNLTIAGKDAETNDSVVKKYLGEKDLYFHADIHGAPSVVMKVSNPSTERGIEEAASFAWCMSKAWNSKFGNGSVFYVTRSQVSKTPESGEYLARGAWIIRGKKNYIIHLNLELAVGFQRYENRDYVVTAPISSIAGRKVIIIPGEEKEEVVKEISEFLGVEKESVYPALPPGTWSVRERVVS
ncbi:MAG: NFACT family protein [Candidatus Thermoplasmatota archaeon]|jgi:predicted ribosome quality control (RQC) complex YloA/Tae2 family protein|nr:NFACT family protein [Candidatus Thermoplasmatota archaeon]